MDFKKVLDQTVGELKREVNKSILKVPEIEQKVLDATSNEPWGPHGTVMGDIAQATRNHYEFQMIMVILWKRLSDTGRNWRHVYKALTVLEYLVAHGSERVIDEIREHAYQISTLADFQYVEPNGKDQGINVRKKSQTLVALVNDKDKIGEVRQKANENRDKYRGVSSTGGMYKPSSYNSTRGSYGGDRYEEDSYSRYGRRDDDRYGRDRDFDRYREDDRYGRDSDRSGRPGDRYRDDRNRDYDNDEDQYSSRRGGDRYSDKSRSYEKDLDRAQDDADHHSSRGAGGRHSDHGEDDKGTAQKPSTAPPSYEAALQSPDLHATRDQSATASSDNKAPSANKTSDDFDDFDDFNPRASSAPSQLDDLFNQSEPRMAVRASQPPPGLSNVLGDASDFFGDSLSSGVTLAPPPVNNFPVQALAGDLFGNDPFKVEASGFSGTATVQTAINPPPSYTLPAGNGVQASVHSSSTAFIKPPPSHTTLTSGSGVAPAPAAGGIAFNAFAPTAPSPPSQTANPTFGGDDLFGFDSFNVSGASSGAPQPAFSLNSVTTPQPAIPGVLQANQPPPTSFSASQPPFSSASQGQPISSNIYTKPQQEKRFETKSTVWADGLSKGLIDLNIGGPKSNPLADIGIDFDLLRTERVKEERVSSGKSVTTGLAVVIMGVSGSGKSTIGNLLADSLGCAFLDADDFHSAENKEKMKQGIPLTDSDRLPWLETLRDLLIDYILWGKIVILSCSALKPSYRNILRTADLEWMLEMQEQEKDQGNVVFKELPDQGLEGIRQLNMRTKSTPEMSKELSSEPSKEYGQLKFNTKSLPLQHRVQFFLLNGPIELFASRLEHRFKEGTHFMPPSLLQSQMDSLNVGKDEEDIIFLDASMSPDGIVIEINKLICHKA